MNERKYTGPDHKELSANNSSVILPCYLKKRGQVMVNAPSKTACLHLPIQHQYCPRWLHTMV